MDINLREYQTDVWYFMWRMKGNTDLLDSNKIEMYYHEGLSPEKAAEMEISRQGREG